MTNRYYRCRNAPGAGVGGFGRSLERGLRKEKAREELLKEKRLRLSVPQGLTAWKEGVVRFTHRCLLPAPKKAFVWNSPHLTRSGSLPHTHHF